MELPLFIHLMGGFMDLKLLRDMADEVGESLGIKIYLLELRDTNDGKELYVECDRSGFIDMDGIVAFSEAYSKRLDTIEDMFDFEYVLNCCSADPEREITGEESLLIVPSNTADFFAFLAIFLIPPKS